MHTRTAQQCLHGMPKSTSHESLSGLSPARAEDAWCTYLIHPHVHVHIHTHMQRHTQYMFHSLSHITAFVHAKVHVHFHTHTRASSGSTTACLPHRHRLTNNHTEPHLLPKCALAQLYFRGEVRRCPQLWPWRTAASLRVQAG